MEAIMVSDNGNGTATQRTKLEPALNQEVRVKLMKEKPYTGENTRGKYFLYSVVDLASGEEMAFFAPRIIFTPSSLRRIWAKIQNLF